MITAAVIEKDGEHIAQALTERFGASVRIVRGGSLAEVAGMEPELIVVSPKAGREMGLSTLPAGCRGAVLPEKLPQTGGAVASYGMSGRDTVSLSSNCGPGRMLCIGGGMTTLGGASIDQQELVVMPRGMTDDELLAVSAAEMLLGLPPEEL